LQRPARILIVEDESVLAQNLRSYLEHRGWDVAVAGSGREAVRAVASFEPSLLLLDYRLPDMDGFELLAALRLRHPRCGCVLMTAHPADVVSPGLALHGIAQFLWKPFSLAEMEIQLALAAAASEPARR
jgi:CheY-like chemotaxis protein